MKSLKLFAATALLAATGIGLYTGTEIIEQAGDRQRSMSTALGEVQVVPIPTVSVDVQVEPDSNRVVAPIEVRPKPDLFQLTIEPVAEGNLSDLDFSLTPSDLTQVDHPSVSTPARTRAVGPGLFSIATSDTFFVPKTNAGGDRPTSAELIRSFGFTSFELDAANPSGSIGSTDPDSNATSDTDSGATSLTPPPSSSTPDPFEIELLKPTSPDPLSTAKGPDTSVPEPGTVTGLLMMGVLGAGSLVRRKLAKRLSEQQ